MADKWGVIPTTYKSWDDPPSRIHKITERVSRHPPDFIDRALSVRKSVSGVSGTPKLVGFEWHGVFDS